MSSGAITLEEAFAVYLLTLYLTQWCSYGEYHFQSKSIEICP